MRHLFGLVLGAALAPAIVAVTGWSLPRIIDGFRGIYILTSATGLLTVGVLAVLALLVGVCLAAPRLSPLAPGLPALVLLGWSGLYVAAPQTATAYLPGDPAVQAAVELLALGLYVPVGVALFLPLLMPSRWRGAPAEAAEDEEYLDDLYEEEEEEEPRRRPARQYGTEPPPPHADAEPEEAPRQGGRRYSGRRRARG